MSPLLKTNKQNQRSLSSSLSTSSTIAAIKINAGASSSTSRNKVKSVHEHTTTTTTKGKNLSATSSMLLSPADEATTLNVDTLVSSTSISTFALFPITDKQQQQQQPITLTEVSALASPSPSTGSGKKLFKTMKSSPSSSSSFKIMSYQNIIAFLIVLVCGLVTVNGLKCYMCGQYNEGVGSITPCLNYSEQYAHLYLKECSKKSEKYCVKYVSELSIVRDCATECAEKEIWETQTYCCTEDGCNGASAIESSTVVVLLPLMIYILNEILNVIKQQRR